MAAASRTTVDRRQLTDSVCDRYREQFGFQADSAKSQSEHVEVLWSSFCSRHEDPLMALEDLHEQLLRTHRDWHAKVWLPLFGEPPGAEGDMDRTRTVASDDAVQEICLFLLVWGELGNLRFCPELHCFLFSAARAYSATADVASSRLWGTSPVPEGVFLQSIVKPIFDVMLTETFLPTTPPKSRFGAAPAPADASNYDDWNELFWDADRLHGALRMRPAAGTSAEGVPAVDACGGVAAELWPLLRDVDWERSLRGQKSHREVHSALPLLVGCYRIFLLQSLCLGVLVLDWSAANQLAGWLGAAALSLLVPFWMALHEIGFLVITPASSRRAQVKSICRLLLFYLSPAATFAVVVLALRTDALVSEEPWPNVILGVHFALSVIVLTVAMLPQKVNFCSWAYYPPINVRRAGGPYMFWTLVVVMALLFNAQLVRSCGDSLFGLWTLHGQDASRQTLVQLVVLFSPTFLCFFSSLLFFTNMTIAFIGSTLGVIRLGGFRLFWYRRGLGFTKVPQDLIRRVLQPSSAKAAPKLAKRMQEPLKAVRWWKWLTDSELEAFVGVWHQMLDELRGRDMIEDKEYEMLSFTGGLQGAREGKVPRLLDPMDVFNISNALPHNPEARRRIVVLARSVEQKNMPSGFVRSSPTLSVLIPHYAEDILYTRDDLFPNDSPSELLRFLVEYYREEFVCFADRSAKAGLEQNGAHAHSLPKKLPKDFERRLCEWASLRMQTLWRTIEGICSSYSRALQALARVQESEFSEEQRHNLVREKFQVILAMQKYQHFSDPSKGNNAHMLAGAEAMLAAFGPWLRIAFIEEEDGPQGRRYFSSLIDATCPLVQLPGKLPSRKPRLRVELPGFPILGHGKSDNQNCAIIYTRGEVLQMIDCNQEAYFEASLFLPTALQEFNQSRSGRRPGILGFREHIFSNVGLLGRIAADNEFAFGTVIQRTMDWPMEARLHYGHPDIMDKLQVLQQGGVSKATKGLNLSEDVFAGLDLTLRGGWTTYKEYFHVGKGRDMGFMSVLSFFSKVAMGNGEQAITRQWLRVALGLPLPRLLGVFYTHIGFFLNQCLINWAMKSFAFMAALFSVCARLDIGADDAAIGTAVSYFGIFYFLFLTTTMMPLLLEVYIESGLCAALRTVGASLMAWSPVFAVFQSKLMGHYFWATLHYGGAQYIATGRGLATSRESFGRLFRTFSPTHMRDGFELILYLIFSHGSNYGLGFYLCTLFAIFAWTLAPFIFNPRQFGQTRQALRDWSDWLGWLWRREGGDEESWETWATKLQDVRKNSTHFVELIPSGRFLALACTLVTALSGEAFRALDLDLPALLGAVLPPGILHFGFCFFVSCGQACPTPVHSRITSYPFLALMGISQVFVELGVVPAYENTISMVLFTKYMWLRFLLEVADGVAARQPGGACFSAVHGACRRWALTWRFIRDLLVGSMLSILVICIAAVPGLARLHNVFLFQTRLHKDRPERAARKRPGFQSLSSSESDSDSDFEGSEDDASLNAPADDPLASFVQRRARRKRRLIEVLRTSACPA